jgi:hypothetical protein
MKADGMIYLPLFDWHSERVCWKVRESCPECDQEFEHNRYHLIQRQRKLDRERLSFSTTTNYHSAVTTITTIILDI